MTPDPKFYMCCEKKFCRDPLFAELLWINFFSFYIQPCSYKNSKCQEYVYLKGEYQSTM